MMSGKLVLIKLHYFLFNAGIAPLMIFGPTIAKQSGFAALTVGLMYAILPLVGLFVKTLGGMIADKFNQKKLVFLLAIFCCLLSTFFMTVLRTNVVRRKTTLLCGTAVYVSTCSNRVLHLQTTPSFNNRSSATMNCEIRCTVDPEFARQLCDSWGHCDSQLEEYISENANKSKRNDVLSSSVTIFAKIEKKHIFKINGCIYAMIKEEVLGIGITKQEFMAPYCKEHVTPICATICDNYEFMNLLKTDKSPFKVDLSNSKFWIIYVIYAISWAGIGLTSSMSDTVCFDMLGNESHLYGKQRMFGALGWGIVSIFAGWMVDASSEDYFDKNYKPLFCLAVILLCFDLVVATFMNVNSNIVSISVYKDVRLLLSSSRTTIFAVWCFVTGLFSGIVWNFLFWFLEDISTAKDLQWSKTLQGLDSLFTTILGELPFFFISGFILKQMGHIRLMSLVLFAISVRLLAYSMLFRPVWVLPIELINGFAFSMCFVVIASYSNLIAPRGTEATVQALFSALFDGLGLSFGSLLGGLVYYQYGGRFMFRFFGYVSVIIGFCHFFIQRKLDSKSENERQFKDNTSEAQYSSPNDAIRILENT